MGRQLGLRRGMPNFYTSYLLDVKIFFQNH